MMSRSAPAPISSTASSATACEFRPALVTAVVRSSAADRTPAQARRADRRQLADRRNIATTTRDGFWHQLEGATMATLPTSSRQTAPRRGKRLTAICMRSGLASRVAARRAADGRRIGSPLLPRPRFPTAVDRAVALRRAVRVRDAAVRQRRAAAGADARADPDRCSATPTISACSRSRISAT